MINKKLLFATLIASSQVSAGGFAGSIGLGGVVRKTTVEVGNDESGSNNILGSNEFEKDGNASYFAARISAKLGMMASKNIFAGIRFSGDAGSDKKNLKDGDHVIAKTKSNFNLSVGPEIAYRINDKISIFGSISFMYQNMKATLEKDALTKEAINSKKDHYYGFGGLLGLNYHFNKAICLFIEAGANYMLKKDVEFATAGKEVGALAVSKSSGAIPAGTIIPNDEKVSRKGSMEFSGSLGVAFTFGA